MESVSRMMFSITERPRIQAVAGSHIEKSDGEASDGGKRKDYVEHGILHSVTASIDARVIARHGGDAARQEPFRPMLDDCKLRGDTVTLSMQVAEIDVPGGPRRGREGCVPVRVERREERDLQQERKRNQQ
jgi:hypothetical protein